MHLSSTFHKKAILALFAFFLAFSLFYTKPVTVHASSNYSRWMSTCNSVLKTMKKYKFHYSNSHTKSTLKRAVAKSRKCNCALYVSWCLQEYGATKAGKTFYVANGGSIHNKSGLSAKAKIIKVYKRCTSTKLKPGDVVCWTDSHVNIYVGKSASGKRLWYDGGKVATASNSNGSRYTHTKARSLGYFNHRTISYIIRIKDL